MCVCLKLKQKAKPVGQFGIVIGLHAPAENTEHTYVCMWGWICSRQWMLDGKWGVR